ncbi:transcription initiation factor TFIID subunit 4-like [Pogoniulus pusillus]|uniref:transcription initiation factor TFIID subunit 4-like n=1 Tax=Pogoniulus pusillus TaxID=488313 RepID=UPI0030B94D99
MGHLQGTRDGGLWGWARLGGARGSAVPLVLVALAPPGALPCRQQRCAPPLGRGVQSRGCPHSPAAPPALLPYVPRLSPAALPGKLTATTFALERPRCIFQQHSSASDAIWLVVAFANASAAFRNPPSRAEVPLYQQLPTRGSYMTLEMAVGTYHCSAPSPAVLRVGGDTACAAQAGQDACNGPLPSPGPYRVKFLLMGCQGPKAESRWSEPILLPREPRCGQPCATRVWGPTPSPAGPTGPTTSPRPCPCPPPAGAAPQGWAALPPALLLCALPSKLAPDVAAACSLPDDALSAPPGVLGAVWCPWPPGVPTATQAGLEPWRELRKHPWPGLGAPPWSATRASAGSCAGARTILAVCAGEEALGSSPLERHLGVLGEEKLDASGQCPEGKAWPGLHPKQSRGGDSATWLWGDLTWATASSSAALGTGRTWSWWGRSGGGTRE